MRDSLIVLRQIQKRSEGQKDEKKWAGTDEEKRAIGKKENRQVQRRQRPTAKAF